jgi:cell division protein FtsB
MMRLFKIILSVYVGICLSFVLNFYFGEAGILQYGKLNQHKSMLLENIAELNIINQKLKSEQEVLKTDSEIIKLLSRDLGYYENDDNIIMVEGYPEKRNFHEIGKLIINTEKNIEINIVFRILTYIVPLIVFILLSIFWKKEKNDT